MLVKTFIKRGRRPFTESELMPNKTYSVRYILSKEEADARGVQAGEQWGIVRLGVKKIMYTWNVEKHVDFFTPDAGSKKYELQYFRAVQHEVQLMDAHIQNIADAKTIEALEAMKATALKTLVAYRASRLHRMVEFLLSLAGKEVER